MTQSGHQPANVRSIDFFLCLKELLNFTRCVFSALCFALSLCTLFFLTSFFLKLGLCSSPSFAVEKSFSCGPSTRFAFDFERPEVVLFIRVVDVAEVVEHGDRLDNSVDSFLAEGCNAQSDDGAAANQMLAQIIVERANPVGSGWSWHFSKHEKISGTSGCHGAARAMSQSRLSGSCRVQ